MATEVILPVTVLADDCDGPAYARVLVTPALVTWAREAREHFRRVKAWDGSTYCLSIFDSSAEFLDDILDKVVKKQAKEAAFHGGNFHLEASLADESVIESKCLGATQANVVEDGILWRSCIEHMNSDIESSTLTWEELGLDEPAENSVPAVGGA